MTRVQQRATVLLAACVLAIGCMLAFAAPQQAQAAETRIAAGSTFERATNLSLANQKRSAANRAEFNSKNDNNFYKFTTSGRDSRYKLTVRSYDGYLIYITVYDATHHRIAYMSTKAKKGKTWTFKNLSRNSVYYVELWRFVSDGSNYIAKGDVLDKGFAESAYPKYRIYLKELVTKPTVSDFVASSPSSGNLKVSYKTSYNTDKVQIQFWWYFQGKKTKANTFNRYCSAQSYTTKVRYPGKKYKVRIRPYSTVNGKKVYGKWTKWKKVKIKK